MRIVYWRSLSDTIYPTKILRMPTNNAILRISQPHLLLAVNYLRCMENVQNNLPYLIVGHSSVPNPSISILLTGEGIKELAKRMKNEDRCRITVWSDVTERGESKKHYQEITILD